jgi:importin subunit alpha-1
MFVGSSTSLAQTDQGDVKHQSLKNSSSITAQQAKQRRLEKQKLLSKKKKNSILNKRRKFNNANTNVSPSELFNIYIDQPSNIASLISELNIVNNTTRVAALKKCRILLSISDNDRIDDLVSQFLAFKDFVPLLLKNLKSVHDESQLEAAWCITNIASSSHDHTSTSSFQ